MQTGDYDCQFMRPGQASAIRELSAANGTPYILAGKDSYIGCGNTSVVYRVRDTRTGQIRAAKLFPNDPAYLWDARLFVEASRRLSGKMVVPDLMGTYELCRGSYFMMVMPLLKALPIRQYGAAVVARGMRRCITAFHKAGFAHGDCHIDNFLWEEETQTVRLIDFGLSFDYENPSMCGFLPHLPRGKNDPTLSLNWDWLVDKIDRNSVASVRYADFLSDNIRVEAIIDQFSV